MRTIIVPIDFSKCSVSAAKFACEIAKQSKTKIVFFHTFHVPIPPPDAVVDIIPTSELAETNNNSLKKLVQKEIKPDSDSLEITYESVAGFAIDEIILASQRHKASMIIMGTKGASGIKKIIFGSNTSSVIGKSNIPVLVVPEKAKFKGFDKIAFAVDLHEVKDNKIFNPLLELALLFNSSVKLFSVKKDVKEPLTMQQAFEKLNLDKVFEKVPHTFHLAKDESVVNAIDDFIKVSKADLVVTIAQKHSFIDVLLNKSITRDLAFHTKVPLLSMPG
jgi:nucleotide-binding universal stress UspA family protein